MKEIIQNKKNHPASIVEKNQDSTENYLFYINMLLKLSVGGK